jgi:hypothetical protein
LFLFSFLSYLVLLDSPQPQKKGCKCELAAPSWNPKVLQEQQTQGQDSTSGEENPLQNRISAAQTEG